MKKKRNRRIVDIGPLLAELKENLDDLKGATEVLTVEEAVEDEIEELKKLPVIDPEKMIPAWRDPDKDPPKVETEVLILYRTESGWYGIRKIFLIGEHTTRSGMTTESRKAGGNTATSTRTMFTITR